MADTQRASDRVTKFCDEYEKVRGLDPVTVHALHAGDEKRQAVLLLADLRELSIGADEHSAEREQSAKLVAELVAKVAEARTVLAALVKYDDEPYLPGQGQAKRYTEAMAKAREIVG